MTRYRTAPRRALVAITVFVVALLATNGCSLEGFDLFPDTAPEEEACADTDDTDTDDTDTDDTDDTDNGSSGGVEMTSSAT